MNKALIVACTLTAALTAEADDPAIVLTPVSLAEVLAAARNAPAARVSGFELEAARAAADAAGAWSSPALRVQTNRLTARAVLGASLPLPIFGTVGAAGREAAAEAETVRAATIVQQRDVLRRAATFWIALARADGGVAAAAIAAGQASEIERIARGRLDAGVGANVDVSAARAARTRAELAAAIAKRAQQASSAELAGVLGWDPMKPLAAAGELPGAEPRSLELLRAHLLTHPERTVAQRRLDAAEATIAQVRSQGWPSLTVEGQVSLSDPTTPGTDVMLGIGLDLPLFARIGDRARAARASAAAKRASVAVAEVELGASLVAAYRRWQAASETLDGLVRDIVPAQERAAALSAQAYREGARDLASALWAYRDLTTVRAEVIAARADLATAWVDLQLAAGYDLGASGAR